MLPSRACPQTLFSLLLSGALLAVPALPVAAQQSLPQDQAAPAVSTDAPAGLSAPQQDETTPGAIATPGSGDAAPVASSPEAADNTPEDSTPEDNTAADGGPAASAEDQAQAQAPVADSVADSGETASGDRAIPSDALPHDLSPWGMFMAADIVVKAVMTLLALASLATWTVLVFKLVELASARSRLARAGKVLNGAVSLDEAATTLSGRSDPGAWLASAARDELNASLPAIDLAGPSGVKERVHSIVERTVAQAGRRLQRGTGLLATVGSIAPFVGLFGTVWGIMHSFIGISESNTTNLAIVAPGIAEALLATAIGLVAAIPAVVIYNHFARSISAYRQALGDVGAAVERLLSRDLDFDRAARQSGRGRLQAVEG